jgi:hypothetical protein
MRFPASQEERRRRESTITALCDFAFFPGAVQAQYIHFKEER